MPRARGLLPLSALMAALPPAPSIIPCVRSEEQTEAQKQRGNNTDDEGSAVWVKVGHICDLKEKAGSAVDTNRMRNLLVQMKHS